MKFIGYVPGFEQQTFSEVRKEKFRQKMAPVTQTRIKNDLLQFENNIRCVPEDPRYRLALIKTFNDFLLPEKVRPIHLVDVFKEDLDIWDKSPGLPWRDHGFRTKGDFKGDREAIRSVRRFWHRVKDGYESGSPDCLAYVSSDACPGDESKVRVPWEYPATITFGEAVFAIPLIRAYQKAGLIAFGFKTEIAGIQNFFNRFNHHKHFSGIHFKNFGKRMPAWLIKHAFDILLCNVDLAHFQGYGITDVERFYRAWNFIQNYFINTTIRTANGLRYKKNQGLPNGSYFTQLIGSVCNYILTTWAYLDQFPEFAEGPSDIVVLDGNSLTAYSSAFDLRKANALFESVGLTVNFKKSQITTELLSMKFLGCTIGDEIFK